MTSIIRADETHARILSGLAGLTFSESHGTSAKPEDVESYVAKNYNNEILREELQDADNIYHIVYYNNQAAGYSKIVLNSPYADSASKNIAKLERIYLLKQFYSSGMGLELFKFNINLIKEHDQVGIWLYVWKENQRAVNFYKKNGFIVIGSHDFKISETHSNPNHQMLLNFK
ncbi:MAG TPA: GNAT family N-acetyltransferase [Ferruginibacter sp.]|nr:GNAT family N-acetyltransferase [Ferruginibacter sp.]